MNKMLFTFIFASLFVSEIQYTKAMENKNYMHDKENYPNNGMNTPKKQKGEESCPDAPRKPRNQPRNQPVPPPAAQVRLDFSDAKMAHYFQAVPNEVFN